MRRARPTVPAAMDAAIRKALAPVPADRFASTADFAKALTLALATTASSTAISVPVGPLPPRVRGGDMLRLAALTAAVITLVAAGVYAWRSREPASAGPPGSLSIAVLPFDNLGDTSDAYFADGITDAVRGKLTAVPGLTVIAPASSAQYRATSKSSQQIGRELGVTYLLTGRVRWAKAPGTPGRVEVSPALIDALSAADKWEHPFDASVTDVFKVQAEIAAQVAHELGIVLGKTTEHRLAAVPTRNLAAYDAYLRGSAIYPADLAIDVPTLRRAVAAYTEAVVLDSTFALAWARLSIAYAAIYDNGSPEPTAGEAARRAASRSMALDSTLPEAWLATGMYNVEVVHDHARGLTDAETGLRLAPSHAELMFLAGFAEARLARWDSAFARLRRTLELNPRSVNALSLLGDAYIRLRRYSEAGTVLDRALSLTPTDVGTINERALLSLGNGDLAGARAVLHAAPQAVDRAALLAFFSNTRSLCWVLDDAEQRYLLALSPAAFGDDRASWAITLAETYAIRGDRARSRAYADTARIAYEAILRDVPGDALSHAYLGEAFAYLGHRDDAIRETGRALTLSPLSRDITVYPASQFELARIHMLFGDRDAAIDQLQALLRVPYYLSPAWLRIDPTFAELHGNPRFERLIADSTPPMQHLRRRRLPSPTGSDRNRTAIATRAAPWPLFLVPRQLHVVHIVSVFLHIGHELIVVCRVQRLAAVARLLFCPPSFPSRGLAEVGVNVPSPRCRNVGVGLPSPCHRTFGSISPAALTLEADERMIEQGAFVGHSRGERRLRCSRWSSGGQFPAPSWRPCSGRMSRRRRTMLPSMPSSASFAVS